MVWNGSKAITAHAVEYDNIKKAQRHRNKPLKVRQRMKQLKVLIKREELAWSSLLVWSYGAIGACAR